MTEEIPKQLGISQRDWDHKYKHYALELIKRACQEGHIRVVRWVMSTHKLSLGAAKYSQDKNYMYNMVRSALYGRHLCMLQWITVTLGITKNELGMYDRYLNSLYLGISDSDTKELYMHQWIYVTHKMPIVVQQRAWSQKTHHRWFQSWQATTIAQSTHLKSHLLCDVLRRMTCF